MTAGDVVLYAIHTIHGSRLTRFDEFRRLVRVGYTGPANEQRRDESEFSTDRSGMIAGNCAPESD